ncbi:MAG: trypsin-like peptidase domain-containing protein, partial [Nitrososphaerota archaeon]
MSRVSIAISIVSIVLVVAAIYEVAVFQSELAALKNSLSDLLSSQATRTTSVTSTSTVTQVTTVILGGGVPSSYGSLYESVKNSVVMIRVRSSAGGGIGSGFVYDERGHIITNNHVVQGADSIKVVFLDGEVYDASLKGSDVDSDIAVIKIDPRDRVLQPLRLGDSHQLKIGDVVAAVGNPLGLEGTLTVGVVSQKDRILPTGRGFSIPGVIQTDAAINPGNSGGPLLNMQGEVVGITTAIEPTGVGIGYAVPSSIIKRVVPALIEKGIYQRSWLGVSGLSLNPEIAQAIGVSVRRGVLVVEVVMGSPAEKAGIMGGRSTMNIDGSRITVGGDIITSIDGTPINSLDEFLLYLEERTAPGQEILLTVHRGGMLLNIKVVL